MNRAKFLLQPAASLIILFSANAYAVPILQVNGAGVVDADTYSVQYHDGGMSHSPEADNVLFPVHSSWSGNSEGNNLLGDVSGLNLLYGLYSAFATPLLSPPVAGFTIFDLPLGVAAHDGDTGSSDENIIGFLVTLGLGSGEWEITGKDPQPAGQQAQPDQAPGNTVTPRAARAECSQRHYGQPQKSGLREDNLCFGGGGLSSAGSRGGGGSLAARGSDFGGNPGGGRSLGGPGVAQSGGGPGGGGPGSNSNGSGSNGSGSNGPGSNSPGSNGPGGNGPGGGYTGPGGIGPGGGGPDDVDPPVTIPVEVGTIPEPATLVLLGLGLASMCIVRGRKTASASRRHAYRN